MRHPSSYYTWSGKLNLTKMIDRLTRPYRPTRRFKNIRVGTWVKWTEPGIGELEGQVWSRAPRGGDWWIVDKNGTAYKVHWKKFSPLKRSDF